jgi:hypothetical protein
MKKQDAEEIIHCLPQDKTLFYYFKDRYAPLLLSKAFTDNTSVSDIKKSRFSPLLNKQVVKQVLANMGGAVLSCKDLLYSWNPNGKQFLLALDTWGADKCDYYYQTSRRGHNLVLQLNFSNQHDKPFKKLVNRDYWFSSYYHPRLNKGDRAYFRETLAWARIDLDFQQGEALIEEIQSDWVRWAKSDYLRAKRKVSCHAESSCRCERMQWYKNIVQYYESVLLPYNDLWAEAMLASAVNFIVGELGLRRIYYHTYETGKAVKRCNPPQSLYTKLPRKFCFQKSNAVPVFLTNDRFFKKKYNKVKNPAWYVLEF